MGHLNVETTNELSGSLSMIAQEMPARVVISNPKSTNTTHIRVEIIRLQGGYQLAKRTGKQVFHENINSNDLCKVMQQLMQDFNQLNAFTDHAEYRLRLTKKGRVQFGRQPVKHGKSVADKPLMPDLGSANQISCLPVHNRKKSYLLEDGQAVKPLIDMGVLTRDGHVIKAMYPKFRQINRFLEMIDDALRDVPQHSRLHVLDFGCGKSYLTFILYHYLSEIRCMDVHITGLDLKADVVKKCNQAARRYGYQNLSFEVGDINGYESAVSVDMVVTLHACDTATDYALYNAIRWGAKMIFSVPCCQHELNAQIQSETYAILTRYGLVKERIAALMTDAIRGNLLQACGYKTQLLEFIDMEHTPKNILIRAVAGQIPKGQKLALQQEAERLMHEYQLNPTLYKLLTENSILHSCGDK